MTRIGIFFDFPFRRVTFFFLTTTNTFFTELFPVEDADTAGVDDGETVVRAGAALEGVGTPEARGADVETGAGLAVPDEPEDVGVAVGASGIGVEEA